MTTLDGARSLPNWSTPSWAASPVYSARSADSSESSSDGAGPDDAPTETWSVPTSSPSDTSSSWNRISPSPGSPSEPAPPNSQEETTVIPPVVVPQPPPPLPPEEPDRKVPIAAIVLLVLLAAGVVVFAIISGQTGAQVRDERDATAVQAVAASAPVVELCKRDDVVGQALRSSPDDPCGKAAQVVTAPVPTVVNGVDGTNGINGQDGTDGRDGRDGITPPCYFTPEQCQGQDGTDGTNGTNGINGQDGTDGTNGTNGTDGRDGRDGTGVDTLTIYNANGSVRYVCTPDDPSTTGVDRPLSCRPPES